MMSQWWVSRSSIAVVILASPNTCGQSANRRPVAVVPITDFVDTSCPHNVNDHIRFGEMKRFGKAVLGGGRLHLRKNPRIPVFSRKQADFPRKTGRRLTTNGQSLRGMRDLDNFSKSK